MALSILQRQGWIGGLTALSGERVTFSNSSSPNHITEMYAGNSPEWTIDTWTKSVSDVVLAREGSAKELLLWAFARDSCGESVGTIHLSSTGKILNTDSGSLKRLYDAKWTGADFITVGTGLPEGLCQNVRIGRWNSVGVQTFSTADLIAPPQNLEVFTATIGSDSILIRSSLGLHAFSWKGEPQWSQIIDDDPLWRIDAAGHFDHAAPLGMLALQDGTFLEFGTLFSPGAAPQGYLRKILTFGGRGWSRKFAHAGPIDGSPTDSLLVEASDGGYYVGGKTLSHLDAFGHATEAESGPCSGYTPDACDDGDPCTLDDCVSPQGCVNTPRVEGESCGANLVCTSGKCSASK